MAQRLIGEPVSRERSLVNHGEDKGKKDRDEKDEPETPETPPEEPTQVPYVVR